MITFENVCFSYERSLPALHVARLIVERGTRVAIAGPSGCGKTTLLNLMAGLIQPQSGTIDVLGHRVSHASDNARRRFRLSQVGQVLQSFELLDYLTVRENLLIPFFLAGVPRSRAMESQIVTRLAKPLGIEHLLNRSVTRLSYGERQRVAIGRALVIEPSLLLADEPTGNLDSRTRDRIVDLLFEYSANTMLVMATHDERLLHRFDRVIRIAEPGDETAIENESDRIYWKPLCVDATRTNRQYGSEIRHS